jgi:hypothetical protein
LTRVTTFALREPTQTLPAPYVTPKGLPPSASRHAAGRGIDPHQPVVHPVGDPEAASARLHERGRNANVHLRRCGGAGRTAAHD